MCGWSQHFDNPAASSRLRSHEAAGRVVPPVIDVVVAIVVTVVVLSTPVVYVVMRVHWLTRQGGSFECSVLLNADDPSHAWVLGVARYAGEDLEWFRYYAASVRPWFQLNRQRCDVVEVRGPDEDEAATLFPGHRIVEVQYTTTTDESERWQLAVSPETLTGLLAWLEASPPGQSPRGIHSPVEHDG